MEVGAAFPWSDVDAFTRRHIGPRAEDVPAMLRTIGVSSLDELVKKTVPASIRLNRPLALGEPMTESDVLLELRSLVGRNRVLRSYLGYGFHDTITPPVILRNIMENPGWYTQYTPYQAEISQGRLEALANFQTMICDLTGLQIANSSLLDEGTAAAEAMMFAERLSGDEGRKTFFVSSACHPHVRSVVETRAEPIGVRVVVGDDKALASLGKDCFGALIAYPTTDGEVRDYRKDVAELKAKGIMVIVDADLLALTVLTPPGEWGADVVVGNTQRFGVPLGFGGPHAAYFATRDEFKREIPGRLVGVSKDSAGQPAYRLALQTREQHIRRERATSNICTAQVLLAIMAGMYAVYHGPRGLKTIARRIQARTLALATVLRAHGCGLKHERFFDTLEVTPPRGVTATGVVQAALARDINLRHGSNGGIIVALDETVKDQDLVDLVLCFSQSGSATEARKEIEKALLASDDDTIDKLVPPALVRTSAYLEHPVFNRYRSESEMLRYITRLQSRDLSLTTSMIPLGSCTMKLNATAEMIPVTWREIGAIHPFAPLDQCEGYLALFRELEASLGEITGMDAVSLQPNAGSQGEYAGLLAIRGYHLSRGDKERTVCLIPISAHGTNPASAVMAGMEVVVVACDNQGNVDVDDLRKKATEHSSRLAALMVTYPSTHGVFEERIREICDIVHSHGGQVYMDGANLNAQVGLCRPGDFGVDVCHLNLHKTFCIPHGGGGPGMGPIVVKKHLQPFMPGHEHGLPDGIGPVCSAPWGSASILVIPWVYIKLMGASGLAEATKYAILNANYIAARLEDHFPVLYRGDNGTVAHECILDLRNFKRSIGIEAGDVAKRLMDYGFHAPTVSFPVVETLMVEPTESESKEELDRFCDAMIAIRKEIRAVEDGKADRAVNVLKNAPHTAEAVTADEWTLPYSRAEAAYPLPYLREHKFWPAVGRIDAAYGDRNLFCTCPTLGPTE